MAMRIDFPINPPTGAYQLLAGHLQRDDAEAALIVAYEPKDNRSGEEVLANVAAAISDLEIPIRELMLVRDGRWRSMLCDDLSCCPPEGNEITDFRNSRITAEQVANGKVLPFSNSEGLAHSIAEGELAKDPKWSAKVASFRVDPEDHELHAKQRDGAEAVLLLADFYIQDGKCDDLDLIARVLGRLSDIQVRDLIRTHCRDE